ncbi:FAD-dependent monooxygenase [Streptomyces sp. NPDC054871]
MSTDPPLVLISGAGPTGLALAGELSGSGIRCHVVEKRRRPSPYSRAFGLMPRTMELLDMRGQLEPYLDAGLPCTHPPLGDLRGHLDYRRLDTPFPYILIIPQSRTEELLEKAALGEGAQIERGAEVTAVHQGPDAVRVEITGSDGTRRTQTADFLVGCDGVRSTVRQSVGIPFPGRDYHQSLMIVDAPLGRPPDPEIYARITRRGMVAAYPFGDGTFRLIILDRQKMTVPVEQPLTLDDASDSIRGILGIDLAPYDPLWLSRFRSAQRHATQYRRGRVLLAGDAAHTHIPSGGQGLQVGIQDAMNLGWKLSAELHGRAPDGLLDSYEQERLPIAEATLRKTDMNFRFEISDSPPARLARWLIMKGGRFGPLQTPVLKEFANFTLRYPPPHRDRHNTLVGTRVPDATLHGREGNGGRLFELFRRRRFVLLDQSTGGRAADLAADGWGERIHAVRSHAQGRVRLPEVLLARPDGYVAWAGDADDPHALRGALTHWCGAARPGATTVRSPVGTTAR